MKRKFRVLISAWKNARFLLRLAWETDKKLVAAYYLSAAIGALMPIGIGVSSKYLIDYLTEHQNNLTVVAWMVVGLIGIRFALTWAEGLVYWIYNVSYVDYLLRSKLQNAINWRFNEKMVAMDAAYFENPEAQNLITKVRDTKTWKLPDMIRGLSFATRSLTMALSAWVVLATFGWWWPVIIAIACIPRLWSQTKLGQVQWSIYGGGAPKSRRLWYFEWVLTEPNVLKEVRIFQSGPYLIKKMRKIQEELFLMYKKPLDSYLLVWTGLNFWEAMVGVVLVYSQLGAIFGSMITVGGLILFIDMSLYLKNNVVDSAIRLGDLLASNLYVDDFRKVMELPDLVKETTRPVKIDTNKAPEIELKRVGFKYPGKEEMVLKDINIKINAGENVALVGVNGAGKSTIIKLLCRFYDPTEGEILVNGVNIKKIAKSDLYRLMGTLFQDFVHFHFTVKENIIMGDPETSDKKRMELAAKQSGASEFIDKLPDGYNQILGREFDDGEEVSGGQWQKLAIARAFYEQAPLLILDEPTSAIDAEAEMEIFTNLQKIYRAKTLLLVSHRFSTVRNAKRIYVIEDGRISEAGSHQELLDRDGKYASMFRAQAKGYAE